MNHTTNPIDAMIWLQFTRIEEYSPVSSSTCVRRSRGHYDRFLAIIRDYHASMAAELTLGSKGSRRTYDLPSKSPHFFTVRPKVPKRGEYIGF